MSDYAIRVKDVGKRYLINLRNDIPTDLKEFLTRSFRSKIGHGRGNRDRSAGQGLREFWALRSISFDLPKGKMLGIIGPNGSGKSTLLKIMSRIVEPTEGRIEYRGRVGSLLEVGTGFHPELTGRENVYLNGVILGMKKREIDAQFDGIVDFSGVEQFLDVPVKRYSSGMQVRLAFSVAAHLRTDILLLDEVLSVGDAAFQQKSDEKMRSVIRDGRTVVLVSHDLETVRSLCDTVMLLNNGSQVTLGSASDVVALYQEQTGLVAHRENYVEL